MVQLQSLNIMNLREHIKRQVSEAILNGSFRPGSRLGEASIADQLGVSRAPVREALLSLEREGLVIGVPRRGFFVIEFTDKDIEEIYSLRLLLEVGALRRAIDKFSEADIERMQSIVDDLGRASVQQSTRVKLIDLDMCFHELIVRAADHSRLHSTWDSMRLQTALLIGLTSSTHLDSPDQPREFHARILDAIRRRNLDEAEARLTEHILDAEERARQAWAELPPTELMRRDVS